MLYTCAASLSPRRQALCINSIAFYIHSCGLFFAFAAHRGRTVDRHDFQTYLAGGCLCWRRHARSIAHRL